MFCDDFTETRSDLGRRCRTGIPDLMQKSLNQRMVDCFTGLESSVITEGFATQKLTLDLSPALQAPDQSVTTQAVVNVELAERQWRRACSGVNSSLRMEVVRRKAMENWVACLPALDRNGNATEEDRVENARGWISSYGNLSAARESSMKVRNETQTDSAKH